jgi:mannose/fructose/N-acetylgalactosamine-specific phosphotransferase system component IIC
MVKSIILEIVLLAVMFGLAVSGPSEVSAMHKSNPGEITELPQVITSFLPVTGAGLLISRSGTLN